jgi:SAM-dependent methyltransferase
MPRKTSHVARRSSLRRGFDFADACEYEVGVSVAFVSRFRAGYADLRLKEFGLAPASCPYCGPSIFLRLNATESGIRCARCAASTIHLSIGLALKEKLNDIGNVDACELSAAGPLVRYLRRHARSFSGSEYFDGVAPGTTVDGVRCEDVQRLTYPDAKFDLITHTDVLEHVPDDARAFSELRRVLRPGGIMLFTIPLSGHAHTVERARLKDGVVEHLLEPVHHVDPLQGGAGILAFRDYGLDVVQRLEHAGFTRVAIEVLETRIPWLGTRAVVCAKA